MGRFLGVDDNGRNLQWARVLIKTVSGSIISGRAALLWHSTMVGASTMGVVGDNKRGWRLGKV